MMYYIQHHCGTLWTGLVNNRIPGIGWTTRLHSAKFYASQEEAQDDFEWKNKSSVAGCAARIRSVDDCQAHEVRLMGNAVQ